MQLGAANQPSGAPRAQTTPNVPDVPAAQTVTNTPSAPSTPAFPSADDFVTSPPSAVGSIFNPNRSTYPVRYGVVSASGIAGNDPVSALVRALDLEFMDTRLTPNVVGRLGSGVPYRDTEGNVFYKTYGPSCEYVGPREVSGGRAQTMTNALADVGLGVATVGLRSNPYAAAGAVLGIAGGITANHPSESVAHQSLGARRLSLVRRKLRT